MDGLTHKLTNREVRQSLAGGPYSASPHEVRTCRAELLALVRPASSRRGSRQSHGAQRDSAQAGTHPNAQF